MFNRRGGTPEPEELPGGLRGDMKKCIVISDSFKGTLSSRDICAIASRELADVFPDCEAAAVPVADGGEGTADCFQEACGGTMVTVTVQDPWGAPVEAAYLRLDEDRAVVEMAASSGLPLAGDRKDPRKTTTYGVGQLIRHAVEGGCREIILGLGGSATNDGGCGCAAALGVRFLDVQGQAFVPVGGTLDQIQTIDLTEARRLLKGVKISAMCDIDNPMHGPSGAAFVFAPQKGASPEAAAFLDRQLWELDQRIRTNLGRDLSQVPGSGAAGAFGAGMLAFFDAELKSGIETVLDVVGFDGLLDGCDLVFTGEGRLDSQSLDGKAISGVARRAKRKGVPVVVLAGSVSGEIEDHPALEELGVSAVFSINRQAQDFEISKAHSRENYACAFRNILRLIRAAGRMRA